MDQREALALFANDLRERVAFAAASDEDGSMRAAAFTELLIEDLKEAGEIEDGHECYYRATGIEVSGYGYGFDGETLDLFITSYFGSTDIVSLTRTQTETLVKRVETFLDRAIAGLYRKLEEASPAFDMALDIHQRWDSITQVRFFVLTDAIVRAEVDLKKQSKTGRTLLNVWDLQRLYRFHTSGQQQEPILIDFVEEFQQPIPCLSAPGDNPDYDTYLAIIPGRVLEALYGNFGARLLELNVRSFLQARGKVNRGIRDTIRDEPGRFLAYNNGISATASSVELVDLPGGSKGIAAIHDLQIVNGGQTTASIYQAARRDKVDVSPVNVQAKITVPKSVSLADLVPLISRYANSQNKVDEADFSANDPFHREIERLSRTVWAEPLPGSLRQTKWFYERARGQYQVELNNMATAARRREFQATFPPAQRFGKTDLAKYVNTWDQLPHLVSLGGQKNFRELVIRMDRSPSPITPDLVYFQRVIAKAILFKQTEKIVGSEKFGGYRANIVTYTLAFLSRFAAGAVDLDAIWAKQSLKPELSDAIRTVAAEVYKIIINPPGGGNVTEWCKKEACWNQVKALQIALPATFLRGSVGGNGVSTGQGAGLSMSELATIAQVSDIPSRTWYEVSVWASKTGNLTYVQRNIAMSISTILASDRTPSIKQAVQGLKLLERARELGFEEGETSVNV